jgi:membrane protein
VGDDGAAADGGEGRLDAAKARLRRLGSAVDRRLPRRVSSLVRRLADGEILLTSSSLAFYGLVSALPLLLIAFAFVEAIAGDEALQRFAEQTSQNGPEGTGRFFDQLVETGGSLTIATVVFSLWPATAYGGGLRRALLRYSDREDVLPGLRGRLLGLGFVLLLPVLVLSGLPLLVFLSSLSGDGGWATALGWAVAFLAGGLIATGVATVVYRVFSRQELDLRETIAGAALTGAVLAAYSVAFVVYLEVGEVEDRFGGGTVAIVVLLGVWLFGANTLLLSGYQAVLELHAEEHGASHDGEDADACGSA